MFRKNQNLGTIEQVSVSRSMQVLVISSLFISLSIVFGKCLAFTVGPFRVSFENLTILMAGILFGPVVGMLVGGCADIIGCLIVGYAINPIITAGAAAVGLFSGLIYNFCFRTKPKLKLFASVGTAHIIGSMIIKSIGLYIYFSYPIPLLLLRIPLYIFTSLVEGYILYLLFNNAAFKQQLERIKHNEL